MKDHSHNRELLLVSYQAADWFVRVKDDRLNAPERRQYLRWLKASPQHVLAILEIVRSYELLRRRKLQGPFLEDGHGSNVIELF